MQDYMTTQEVAISNKHARRIAATIKPINGGGFHSAIRDRGLERGTEAAIKLAMEICNLSEPDAREYVKQIMKTRAA